MADMEHEFALTSDGGDMTPHDIEIAFSQAIVDAGLGDTLIPADGKLHRFKVPTDKGRQCTGWAVLHADGLPAGVAGYWRTGERIKWTGTGEAAKLSRADRCELAELRRKRKAAFADIQTSRSTVRSLAYYRMSRTKSLSYSPGISRQKAKLTSPSQSGRKNRS